jgi:hypothetical protein
MNRLCKDYEWCPAHIFNTDKVWKIHILLMNLRTKSFQGWHKEFSNLTENKKMMHYSFPRLVNSKNEYMKLSLTKHILPKSIKQWEPLWLVYASLSLVTPNLQGQKSKDFTTSNLIWLALSVWCFWKRNRDGQYYREKRKKLGQQK